MRRWLAATMMMLLLMAQAGAAQGGGDFTAVDPSGDDYGAGSYIYPTNPAFEPFHGLFDLTSFAVSSDIKAVRFDLTFAELRNPWRAPEGFSHQLIEVYICRGHGGRTTTLQPGAYVRFAPKYPWDVLLKAAPWESSEMVMLAGGTVDKHLIQAGVLGGNNIRLTVPLALLGEPQASWRYYVLIGGYDGFGQDNFRPVMAKSGEWCFGGGTDLALEPQVIDVLAPARGPYSQSKQLRGYNAAEKTLAMLMPVGPGFNPGGQGFPWRFLLILLLFLVAAGWWYWYAPVEHKERVGKMLGRWFGKKEGP